MKNRGTRYSGVRGIVLHNSDVEIDCSFNPIHPNNILRRVSVGNVRPRGGEDNTGENYKDGVLTLENVSAKVRIPYGGRVDLRASENSKASGRFFEGRLKCDGTSSIDVENSYDITRKLGPVGSALAGVAADLSYIAALTLPATAVGVPLVKTLGPAFGYEGGISGALDEFALAAAGTYVGIRGSIKRAFFTSVITAGVIIFGPEIKELFTEGVSAGLAEFGWEDIKELMLYGLLWGAGKFGRDYYVDKTRRY